MTPTVYPSIIFNHSPFFSSCIHCSFQHWLRKMIWVRGRQQCPIQVQVVQPLYFTSNLLSVTESNKKSKGVTAPSPPTSMFNISLYSKLATVAELAMCYATPKFMTIYSPLTYQGGLHRGSRGAAAAPPPQLEHWGGIAPQTLGYNTEGCLRVHYCLYSVTVHTS